MKKKQKNKIIQTFIACLMVAPTAAAPAAANEDNKSYTSGFYVGAFQGVSHVSSKIKVNYVDPPSNKRGNFSPIHSSVIFGGQGGYRYFFNNGISSGFDIDFSKTDNVIKARYDDRVALTDTHLDTKIRRTYLTIPSISVGYKINNSFHAFGKIGLSIGKFKYSIKSMEESTGIEKNLAEKSFTSYAVVPTVGGEYSFNKNWSVNLAFSYEKFNKKLKVFPATNIDTDTFSTNTKENIYTQKLGLIYKF